MICRRRIAVFFRRYSWKSVTKTLFAVTTECGESIFVFCCIGRDAACAPFCQHRRPPPLLAQAYQEQKAMIRESIRDTSGLH